MDKEQIFSTLSNKLGKTSLSERTIKAYVSGLVLPTEDVNDDWYNPHVEMLKSLGGQFSHDVAEEIENFKKNFKPEPPKPNDPPKNDPPKPTESEEFKALMKEIEDMKAKYSGMETKAREDAIRNAAIAKGTTLNAREAAWKLAVSQVAIDANTTDETFLELVKPRYETLAKEFYGDQEPPYGGNGGGDNTTKEALDNFFATKFGKK